MAARREAAVHFDTGLSWVDVEDDFSRARRRQVLADDLEELLRLA